MSNLFPKSVNRLPFQIIIYLVVFSGILTAGVSYYMTPKYTRVGSLVIPVQSDLADALGKDVPDVTTKSQRA